MTTAPAPITGAGDTKPRSRLHLVHDGMHGTLTGYRYGCRCDKCKTARSEYLREWRSGVRRRKPSDGIARLEAAQRRYERALEDRNKAVTVAFQAGCAARHISHIVGFSDDTVYRIVNNELVRPPSGPRRGQAP